MGYNSSIYTVLIINWTHVFICNYFVVPHKSNIFKQTARGKYMGNFKNVNLKSSYDSDEDDILRDFYIPVLANSVRYDRLAGYFTSSTLAAAARGMADFIKNNGKMRLVTNLEMRPEDVKAVYDGTSQSKQVIEDAFLKELDMTDNLQRNYIAALAWMVSQGNLEIKIAITKNNSIYHQKVGILYDTKNQRITFSGSVNETGNAWNKNIEEFKVFSDWKPGQETYGDADSNMFEKFWSNSSKNAKVIDIPSAVRERLVKMAPKTKEEVIESISVFSLRPYQYDAVNSWCKNNYRGILEMATGTGKTFIALGCINRLTRHTDRLVVVIACPYTHLVNQWKDSFKEYNQNFKESWKNNDFNLQECYNNRHTWEKELKKQIRNFNTQDVDGRYFLNKLVIFTTHDTLTSKSFIEIIKGIVSLTLLVADEVHALGSKSRFKNLAEYQYRLDLSATLDRYFDDEGTANLKKHFGGVVAEYPIERAIEENVLSHYKYIPHIVDLNNEEMKQYLDLTRKIAKKMMMKNEDHEDEELNNFIEGKRADIIAAAAKKLDAFIDILETSRLSQCLIYCHPEQLDPIKNILFNKNIIFRQITFREPTDKRTEILEGLAQQEYDVVVAIRCLDEGVDIPSAKMGIILASTGNPRQYIQRRGRLLRKAEGKDEAIIHDILVVPYIDAPDKISPIERKIVQREMKRYSNFARYATNSEEAEMLITNVRTVYEV